MQAAAAAAGAVWCRQPLLPPNVLRGRFCLQTFYAEDKLAAKISHRFLAVVCFVIVVCVAAAAVYICSHHNQLVISNIKTIYYLVFHRRLTSLSCYLPIKEVLQ